MANIYEIHYTNNPERGDDFKRATKKADAMKQAGELAKIYANVWVERVKMYDEETYGDFTMIAEFENGKRVGVVNIH